MHVLVFAEYRLIDSFQKLQSHLYPSDGSLKEKQASGNFLPKWRVTKGQQTNAQFLPKWQVTEREANKCPVPPKLTGH